ncbi:MAG: aminotransferase class V-fold PLP-dependent enzyme [Candidatus Heimdallarchaeota archaeon]|nr:aminotransferase class V-fold PLP-dependent enzyme [Candidatus Heimdallarchaeota archaeon]MCK4876548.1 aminotransferase class V-fold PLP-dependent enzyme [Candidatus Heimdallarchaeota archaeon]
MSNNRHNFDLEFSLPNEDTYLDSATLGKLPTSSIRKIQDFYGTNIGGTIRGTHKLAIEASKVLEGKRDAISRIFNVAPNQLSFLPSREVAILNSLFYLDKTGKNKILTSVLEDHSILAPLIKFSEIFNLEIDYLSLKDEENLLDNLNERISSETKAVVLSALTLGIGVKRDWENISKICKDREVPFILDISHSVGHEPYNFTEQSPDIILSSGSSGALGPPGIAFQILAEDIDKTFEPFLVGGGSIVSLNTKSFKLLSGSNKYEPGQLNLAAIVGLENSLTELRNIGFEKIKSYETKLRNLIVDGLNSTSKISLIERDGLEYGPIISFMSEEIDAHDIAIILEDLGKIFVRSGALCSHLFMDEIGEDSLIQVSTHVYNTEEDIGKFNELLNSIMEEI